MSHITNIKLATAAAAVLAVCSCSSTFDEDYNIKNTVSFPEGVPNGMKTITTLFNQTKLNVALHKDETSGILDDDGIYNKFESISDKSSSCDAYMYNGSLPASATKLVPNGDITIIKNPDVEQLTRLSKNERNYDFTRFKGCAFLGIDEFGGVYCVPKFLNNDSIGTMNGLVMWMNRHADNHSKKKHALLTSSDLPDATTLFDSFNSGYTLNFSMTKTVASVACSDKDNISGTGTVDIIYSVLPLHAFEDQTSPGDYYYVNGTAQLNSSGMYKGNYTTSHGAVDVDICGFFAREFDTESYIADSLGNVLGSYVSGGTPSPSTTSGSTTYTSGVEWSFSGEITGGLDSGSGTGSATLSAGVTISNSTENEISDTDIALDATDTKAIYNYTFNNLPEFDDWDLEISDPPSVSTSTATFNYEYIIYVPNVPDYSTVRHKMMVNVNDIKYGAMAAVMSGVGTEYTYDIDDLSTSITGLDGTTNYIDIPLPNRIPTGTLNLEHDDSTKGAYIDSVFTTVTACSSDPTRVGKTYSFTTSSYGIGEAFEQILPTATYDVVIYVSDGNGSVSAYKTTGVEITRAATTYKNSGDNFSAVTSARNHTARKGKA